MFRKHHDRSKRREMYAQKLSVTSQKTNFSAAPLREPNLASGWPVGRM